MRRKSSIGVGVGQSGGSAVAGRARLTTTSDVDVESPLGAMHDAKHARAES
jgi:hypothetical protein